MEASMTKTCEICKIAVSKKHYARHLKMRKHLIKWAESEGLHDFQSKSPLELEAIQKLIQLRKTVDYSAYNIHKLKKLAQEKGLEVTPDTSREKLIKRLFKINDYANTKLHYFCIQKIQQLAKEHELKSIYSKNKDELIGEICNKKGLFYCHPCKLAVKDRELHEISERHCVKTGAGLNEVNEYSKTNKFTAIIFNSTSPKGDEKLQDIPKFLESLTPRLIEKLSNPRKNVKLYMSLECEYLRDRIDKSRQLTTMTFNSKMTILSTAENIKDAIEKHHVDLIDKEGKNQPPQGSGWSLNRVMRLIVKTAQFNPLSPSSYIDLPNWVKHKVACINIQNKDERCFIYSILCALNEPSGHPERQSKYSDHINDELFQSFEYPMKLSDIKTFERRSQQDFPGYPSMAVNVFEVGDKKEDIRPFLISSNNKTAQKIIDLLLITSGNRWHYVYIKNLSRLVSSQVSKHNGQLYICRSCLSHFLTQLKLDKHTEYCEDHKPCAMIMPEPNTTIKFENNKNKFPHPYVVYADFECLANKIFDNSDTKVGKLTKHIPYGFSTYLVSRVNGEKFQPFVHRAKSEDELQMVPRKFIEKLHDILLFIAEQYEHPKPMNLTDEEENSFRAATICHICENPFLNPEDKVRDHCHLEGIYLGAAHSSPCNLNRRLITKIPVFIHNMSNYDSHLFIEELFQYEGGRMMVIPNTDEKYIAFTKDMFKVEEEGKTYFKLSFVDSFRFLSSSLEKLASNLDQEQLNHLSCFVQGGLGEYLNIAEEDQGFLILRNNGIFPYSYVDCLGKLEHTTLLKPEDFYDNLNNQDISPTDYEKYQTVWNYLKHRDLGTYSDLYNLQDTLLLADVFENFRDICMENYYLDPAYYLTAPSLSWDAMLKMTNCEIELVSDPDMHLMFEKWIRGGISQVCKRHVKANNQYLEDYDPMKPRNYLMYMDACNLYGWALSQPLPYRKFEWVDANSHTLENWISLIMGHNQNDEMGYIQEVDLQYPQSLHNSHTNVPFAPEHFNNKLCTTLHDKSKYIVHIRVLKQIIENGLIVTDVHRVIQFEQKSFIQPYVEFNSEKRKAAKNDFQKNLYKLMVNSVFGRTMMNLRKRQNIKLCNEAQAHKTSKKPSFRRWTFFSEDFFACHMQKNKLVLNQPIQIGGAVLDISKYLMYDFMYSKPKVWDPTVNLALMDTDSYLVEMFTDPYEIIKAHQEEFDTSNYPHNHPLYSPTNKNVPGKMKDELGGIPMTEVCGLRAKLYTYLYHDKIKNKEKGEIRCKGIKKSVAKKTIRMNDFKAALFENHRLFRQAVNICSSKHVLFTEKQTKLALSSNDDKRFILENKVDTLPWGHCDIPHTDPEVEPMEVD